MNLAGDGASAALKRLDIMRFRHLAIVALTLAAGCRQASPAEVGAQSMRDAHPRATTMASGRAFQVSPQEIAPAAAGAPIRQPRQPIL